MDVNKNSYTFIFAFAMVVVVAAVLSFTASSLKERQKLNVEQEKKQSILKSIGIDVSREESSKAYDQYITDAVIVQNNELAEGNAFAVRMEKQVDKAPKERQAPLYIANKEGKRFFIIPLRGKGLWGPIWGYIALNEDLASVYGANFDHKSETPGLGAEISTEEFEKQFEDQRIMGPDGKFRSIAVKKGNAQGKYEVDGISGGTITSNGVENMLADCLIAYVDFLKSNADRLRSGKMAQKQ